MRRELEKLESEAERLKDDVKSLTLQLNEALATRDKLNKDVEVSH